jgi:D-glycero-beta-D-manno-heptose-7-phosphate kinase
MPSDLEAARLSALIAGFADRRILVAGDLMLDEFIWGKVSRISPEAPVPIVSVTGESYYPGGAANVARNVREFTPHTALLGLAASDAAGARLLQLLSSAGIDTAGVQQDSAATTTVKTRIIARHQQVVRVDRERAAPLTAAQTERAAAYIDRIIPTLDAIIVADYGKGFLTQPLADRLARAARAHRKILAVDPHPHTSLSWTGATIVKPNRAEAFLAAGLPPSDDDAPLFEAGRLLLERWNPAALLITLGEHGMLLLEKDAPPYRIPARAKDVFDVSGAGDTAIAVLTLALAAGATPPEAAELANRAAAIAVGKLGTATVSVSELQASLAE